MRLLFIAFIALLSTTAFSQENSRKFPHADLIDQQVIPEDTAYLKGVLDNGLTYYVCKSDTSEKRVYFRLLLRGGRLAEKENEIGIAHFVEHLVFNGSKHFPTTDCLNSFLRRNGIPLGNDSNGTTGDEEVYYLFNGIPSDNKVLQDSCLLFLRDVAGDATISDAAIEGERNIVVEELRGRSNTFLTILKKEKELFNKSLYAWRTVSREIDNVQHCPPELVRDFYKRWYQPQNLAVIAVGDLCPEEMAEKIRNLFGDLKRGAFVVPQLPPTIATDTSEFVAFSATKANSTTVSVNVRVPRPAHKEQMTVADFKHDWIEKNITYILDKKLSALKENYDIIDGGNSFIREKLKTADAKHLSIDAYTSAGNWEPALELLLRQIEQLRRKGFASDDLPKPIKISLADTDSIDALFLIDTDSIDNDDSIYNADTTSLNFDFKPSSWEIRNSERWIDELTTNFLNGKSIISGESKGIVDEHLRATVTPEEFNEVFRKMTDGRNMYIYIRQKPNDPSPTQEEMKEVYDRVLAMTDEELALKEEKKEEKTVKIDIDSLELNPIPGTLKEMRVRNDSISEAMLSNGIRVVFWNKRDKDNEDNGHMKFVRPMGSSVLSDEDYPYLSIDKWHKGCVKKNFEIYENTRKEMAKEWSDGLRVSDFSMWNMEPALKYIHAWLTSTEIDSTAFSNSYKRLLQSAQSANDPDKQAEFRVNNLFSANPQRKLPLTPEKAKSLNIAHFKELVDDYYSNFNGSVLVIQGEFKDDYVIDSIMPFVLKYIASLPSKPEPAHYVVRPYDHFRTRNTTIEEKIENDIPLSKTYMYYTWEKGFKSTLETQAHNQVLTRVMNNLLSDVIREQHSDVYSPWCGIEDNFVPIDRMKCTIYFSCKPSERKRIAKDINRLIHDMADGDLITQELINGYIKEREKAKRSVFDDPNPALTALINRELYGMGIDETDLTYIHKVTPQSLKAHLKRLLKKGNLHIGYLTTE